MDTAYLRKLIGRIKAASLRIAPSTPLLYAPFIPINKEFKPIAEGISGSPLLMRVFSSNSLPELANGLFKTAIAVGAMIAVLRIAYGGYTLMMSDMPGKRGNAKEIITDSLLGLVLLLAVWLILNTINPQILNLDLLNSLTPIQK